MSEKFNSYQFTNNLENELRSGQYGTEYDDMLEHVESEIENECIYNATCFEIVQDLSVTDWSDLVSEFGEINSISQLAYCSLRQHFLDTIDINEISEELEEKQEEIRNNIDELEEKIDEIECEISELKDTIEELEDEESNNEDEINKTRNIISGLEDDIKNVKAEIKELEDKLI